MIFEDPSELKERIESVARRRVYRDVAVTDDTSDYLGISGGTVVRLGGRDYYVTGEATEGRFGIADQPKFWVKWAVDLTDGARKILKLVFHEQFTTTLGPFTVRCIRNPDKESAVLDLVAGDERFMQGHTVRDAAGNNVRIIDVIRGDSFFNHVGLIEQDHETYFRETLPGILGKLAGSIEALAHLERHQLSHGDVRNDHILVERDTGTYRWIDFDYETNFLDYDVWSVGNIVAYAVAKGIRTCRDANARAGESGDAICAADSLLFHKYRLANLRKLYPYVPTALNDVLMRFSSETVDFYDDLAQVAADLRALDLGAP